MQNELATIVQSSGLQPAQAKPLLDSFGDYFVQAHKLTAKAKGIKVTDVSQVDEMSKAREIRIELKNLRVEANKTRVALKEGYLRGGNAVQDIFNNIKDIVKPMEEYLEDQEKFAERIQAEKDNATERERAEKLSKYVDDVEIYSLHPNQLSTESFEKILETSKIAFEAKLEAEKREEKERLELEKKQDMFRNRQIILAPLSDFIDVNKLTLETSQTEYEQMIETAKKSKAEYDENQEKIRKENERLQAEKEKAEKAQREAEEKLLKEKQLQEKKEREAREADEAKKKAEEELQKKALLAPDKEKLLEFAKQLRVIKAPAVKSKEADMVLEESMEILNQAIEILQEGAKKL